MVLSRRPASAAGLVPVDCGRRAAWRPIVQRYSDSPCTRVPSVPAKAVVQPGIPTATGPRAILRKDPEDGIVSGDAYVRVRRQRRSSAGRSEEHTSELQSLMRISYAVFCLKKKLQKNRKTNKENQQQYTE